MSRSSVFTKIIIIVTRRTVFLWKVPNRYWVGKILGLQNSAIFFMQGCWICGLDYGDCRGQWRLVVRKPLWWWVTLEAGRFTHFCNRMYVILYDKLIFFSIPLYVNMLAQVKLQSFVIIIYKNKTFYSMMWPMYSSRQLHLLQW